MLPELNEQLPDNLRQLGQGAAWSRLLSLQPGKCVSLSGWRAADLVLPHGGGWAHTRYLLEFGVDVTRLTERLKKVEDHWPPSALVTMTDRFGVLPRACSAGGPLSLGLGLGQDPSSTIPRQELQKPGAQRTPSMPIASSPDEQSADS
jgi:hypothetical protein